MEIENQFESTLNDMIDTCFCTPLVEEPFSVPIILVKHNQPFKPISVKVIEQIDRFVVKTNDNNYKLTNETEIYDAWNDDHVIMLPYLSSDNIKNIDPSIIYLVENVLRKFIFSIDKEHVLLKIEYLKLKGQSHKLWECLYLWQHLLRKLIDANFEKELKDKRITEEEYQYHKLYFKIPHSRIDFLLDEIDLLKSRNPGANTFRNNQSYNNLFTILENRYKSILLSQKNNLPYCLQRNSFKKINEQYEVINNLLPQSSLSQSSLVEAIPISCINPSEEQVAKFMFKFFSRMKDSTSSVFIQYPRVNGEIIKIYPDQFGPNDDKEIQKIELYSNHAVNVVPGSIWFKINNKFVWLVYTFCDGWRASVACLSVWEFIKNKEGQSVAIRCSNQSITSEFLVGYIGSSNDQISFDYPYGLKCCCWCGQQNCKKTDVCHGKEPTSILPSWFSLQRKLYTSIYTNLCYLFETPVPDECIDKIMILFVKANFDLTLADKSMFEKTKLFSILELFCSKSS